MAKPLMRLTNNNTPFVFDDSYIEAFKQLKNQLIFSLILYYYDLDLELILEIDASNRVVVGILL